MFHPKTWLSGCLLLLLSACSSNQIASTHYYQLPDSAFRLPEKNSRHVGIKIQLSQALKSNSLLYQTDDYTLNFAQNNVWSAPLEEALTAALSNKLNRISSLNYLPAHAHKQTDLTIYFDRFQGKHTGETEISGYAKWDNGQQKAFHVITPQHGDGYPAMTESLNQGLDEVAKQIAP